MTVSEMKISILVGSDDVGKNYKLLISVINNISLPKCIWRVFSHCNYKIRDCVCCAGNKNDNAYGYDSLVVEIELNVLCKQRHFCFEHYVIPEM